MTHASASPRSLRRVALAVLLGSFLAPFPADGQVPRVPRQAQDAAARAAGVEQPKTQCRAAQAPVFDSVTVELNAARLERLMKALRARRDVLEGRRGGPSWDAMVSRRDAAANAADDLLNRKRAEMNDYHDRRRAVEQCRIEAFSEKSAARRNANTQRMMSDPDFMQRMALLSQQILEAQQRGDTAAALRFARESQALMDGPTREDTLAVDRHCGQLPRPPASLVQYDSLGALQDTLNAQMRRREHQADTAAVSASGGLTARQLALGEERAQMFLAAQASEAAVCGFSDAELVALKAKQAELDELL